RHVAAVRGADLGVPQKGEELPGGVLGPLGGPARAGAGRVRLLAGGPRAAVALTGGPMSLVGWVEPARAQRGRAQPTPGAGPTGWVARSCAKPPDRSTHPTGGIVDTDVDRAADDQTPDDPAAVKAAWNAELRRRVEEIESGMVTPTLFEEMFRRSRQKYP